MDLSEFKVEGPPSMYYIPSFISEQDEKYLMNKIYTAPKPKWTQLAARRLQNWGGLPHPRGMIAEGLPPWLNKAVEDVTRLGVFDGKVANHVLVNEYLPGQGIHPHLDGSLFYPTITTISLASHTVLNFYTPVCDIENDIPDYEQRLKFSLLLEPRSLLILQDECYRSLLHGIDGVTTDTIGPCCLNARAAGFDLDHKLERGTRISLTIRVVPRTSRKFKIGGR